MYLSKEEWIKKIDFIDEMRSRFSVAENEMLKLPQIIVVGDQSSGKSSILQAISGIKLPRGVNTVTRCPVVMQMRKSSVTKTQIRYRSEPFKDISDTESEINEIQRNAFNNEVTKDPITISIQSPESVTLTIIDLPGLVKADVQGQASDMIEKTHEIARDFMMQENSLIICVLPANQDICTTTTIKEATECNPDKSRIIGVLTKLDKLDEKEVTLIPEIIRNQKLPIEKGYYGLIVNDDILELTNKDEIKKTEKKILKEKKLWSLEDIKRFGLSNFTDALVDELGWLIDKTLPVLRSNVDNLLKITNGKLDSFSKYQGGDEVQKKFISEKIKDIENKTKNLLVKGKHEIFGYDNFKCFLEKNGILDSIKEHETFLYMWHNVFNGLYGKFNCVFEELFNDGYGKYRKENHLENINKKNRTEDIPIYISSRLFKKIVEEALLKFREKTDECVKLCCRIISFIIQDVLVKDFEVKLLPLKKDIQKISRRVLKEKEVEIENYLTFLFKSERTYFTQDTIIEGQAVLTAQNLVPTSNAGNKLFSNQQSNSILFGTNISPENFQTENGKILKHCLTKYLKNAIRKLGDVIPCFIKQSLFVDFSASLTAALEMEVLYSNKSLSYFALTDEDRNELERLRESRKSLKEYSKRLNDFDS